MSTAPLELLPISVHLPPEIIIKIAEACIDPYSIKVNSPSEDESPCNTDIGNCPRSGKVTAHPKVPAFRLAIVSRAFCTGIERGVRKNFNGRLTLPVWYVKRANDALKNHGLDWVIRRVKHFHLNLWGDDHLDLNYQQAYSRYNRVKNITLTYKPDKTYPDKFSTLVRLHPSGTTREARALLKVLRSRVRLSKITMVKMIFPVGTEEAVSFYLNEELRFKDLALSPVTSYRTDALDWNIRSPLNQEESTVVSASS